MNLYHIVFNTFSLDLVENARRVSNLSKFESHRFHRDIFNSGGKIDRWPDRVPIPEFHGQFPRDWNDEETRVFLLRSLHPDARERTSFTKPPRCSSPSYV